MIIKKFSSFYVYYYCFVKAFFSRRNGFLSSESEAILFITLIEAAILIVLFFFLVIFLEIPMGEIKSNAYISFPAAFLVYVVNYYSLLHKDRWLSYQKEIDEMPSRKVRFLKLLSVLVTICLLLLVGGFLVFATLEGGKPQ